MAHQRTEAAGRTAHASGVALVYRSGFRSGDSAPFQTDLVVRMNLMDFLGEWDFCRLRRIVTSILMELGGEKKGVAEVVRLGWATKPDCKRFLKSVNLGSEYYWGAHSPLEHPGQNKNPMPLVAAVEFMRQLLARWIESKIAIAK